MPSMMPSDSESEGGPIGTEARSVPIRVVRQGHWGKWSVLVGIATIVAALVAGLLLRAGMASANRPTGDAPTSARWQTYHDPFGLYTLQLPSSWSAHVVSSDVTLETVTFDDPEQGKASARVSITATAIDSQSVCRMPIPHQSFSGLTLGAMEQAGALAIVYTNSESFQVDVMIPGVLAPATFDAAAPTPTPLPAAQTNSDRTEVNTLLVSFHPTDAKPLTC